MAQAEHFDALVLGSGSGGNILAWHLARSGQRATVVERRYVGGACVNIACMPSKNEIWGARIAYLARHAAQFGVITGPVKTDMVKVRQRKRDMVDLHWFLPCDVPRRNVAIKLACQRPGGISEKPRLWKSSEFRRRR